MSRKHKRQHTDHVEPDLPITPMLDMSFQLMAFFLLTFRPMPTEGQLALALPAKEGGGASISDPLMDEKAEDVSVVVDANVDGKILSMKFQDSVGTQDLGAALENYQKAVQAKVAAAAKAGNKKLGKLKLEIDKNLIHEYVVHLIDVGVRAGYTDISPEPKKEPGAPRR